MSQEQTPILLVDDRPANLVALGALLDRPDYELVTAGSGEEALRQVLKRDFAVILLDVAMPGLDGFETAALIKRRARTAHLPVIFITASAHDEASLDRGYSAGAVDFLRKPVDAFAVRAKVAVFVELYRQRRKIEEQAAQLRQSERQERELEFARIQLANEARYRRRLTTQYEVVSLLGTGGTLEEVAPRLVQIVGERLGWQAATLWVPCGESPRALAHWSANGDPARETPRVRRALEGAANALEPAGDEWASTCAPVFCGGRAVAAIELRAPLSPDEDGATTLATVCGQLGLFLERRHAVTARVDSEERLETTLKSIADAVIATGVRDEVTFINPVAETLIGCSREVLGRPLSEVFRVVEQDTGRACSHEALAAQPALGTLALLRSDGQQVAITGSVAPIRTDAGERLGEVVVFRDVSEKRRDAERRRLLAEASAVLYRSLDPQETLENLAQLVVPRLGEWCVVQTADPGEPPKTIAVTHQEHDRGPALRQLARLLERAVPGCALRRARELGEAQVRPKLDSAWLAALCASPAERDAALSVGLESLVAVPLLAHGQVLGVVAFGSGAGRSRPSPADLALAEELAGRAAIALDNALLYGEARRAVRLRDEFLSIASHELRTPLSALQLQLQSMDRLVGNEVQDPTGRLGHKLTHSIKQTRRLGRLVDSLLDVSRISAGKLQLQLELFDLGELVREVTERLQEEARRAGCVLEVEHEPAVGNWDRLRLEQVLVNLLSNAIKYAPGRPVHVRVAVGERVQLSVRDHGIGIAGEDVERIFGMFERAVSIRHYGGLGLGLYIVRQIVEAHGGKVEVESAPREGSTFTVSLPVHAADARAAAAELQ